jgi:hypothetical protein
MSSIFLDLRDCYGVIVSDLEANDELFEFGLNSLGQWWIRRREIVFINFYDGNGKSWESSIS